MPQSARFGRHGIKGVIDGDDALEMSGVVDDRYCKQVDRWRKLKAPEPRREALRQVVERIELKDREVTIHFRLAGDLPTAR